MAFWHALTILLPRWKRLLLIPLLVGAMAAAWRLQTPSMWRAEAALIPMSSGNNASAIAGFASQLGFNVQGTDPLQSPSVYVELLRSRSFLEQVIDSAGGETALAAALDIDAVDSGRRHELLLTAMRDLTSVTADPKTNVVQIASIARDTTLALKLVEHSLTIVQGMIVDRRQRRFGAERVFATERRSAAEAELHSADNALRDFRMTNRAWQNSPRLMTEAERLQRHVGQAQMLVQALRQAEEQSRLDAMRDTPLFTVIQPPYASRVPEGRGTILYGVLAALATFGATAAFLLLAHALRGLRVETPLA
jgi:uncharacterized protein involved in exopolysaccharide biosynthesis